MNKNKTFRVKHAETISQKQKSWRESNKHKKKAHNAVATAIKSGCLIRPASCDVCTAGCKPDAHHNDYSKPLAVIWMCKKCHSKHHGVCVGVKKNYASGESHPMVKLNSESVEEIRRLLRLGNSGRGIARKYGVSEALIRQIRDGKIWKHAMNKSTEEKK